jgi:hypothetical protein
VKDGVEKLRMQASIHNLGSQPRRRLNLLASFYKLRSYQDRFLSTRYCHYRALNSLWTRFARTSDIRRTALLRCSYLQLCTHAKVVFYIVTNEIHQSLDTIVKMESNGELSPHHHSEEAVNDAGNMSDNQGNGEESDRPVDHETSTHEGHTESDVDEHSSLNRVQKVKVRQKLKSCISACRFADQVVPSYIFPY